MRYRCRRSISGLEYMFFPDRIRNGIEEVRRLSCPLDFLQLCKYTNSAHALLTELINERQSAGGLKVPFNLRRIVSLVLAIRG